MFWKPELIQDRYAAPINSSSAISSDDDDDDKDDDADTDI